MENRETADLKGTLVLRVGLERQGAMETLEPKGQWDSRGQMGSWAREVLQAGRESRASLVLRGCLACLV